MFSDGWRNVKFSGELRLLETSDAEPPRLQQKVYRQQFGAGGQLLREEWTWLDVPVVAED